MKYQEHQLQIACIKWFNLQYPKGIMISIPNASKRSVIEGAWMKAEGLTAGFPDSLIIFDDKILFVEFKIGKNKLTEKQAKMIKRIEDNGFYVFVCRTFYEFVNTVNSSLKSAE